jgi:hypothetical protein
MAAPTNPCYVKTLLAQLGAVHTWHICDIVLCPLVFCLRHLSGRVAETLGGPGLTPLRTFGTRREKVSKRSEELIICLVPRR